MVWGWWACDFGGETADHPQKKRIAGSDGSRDGGRVIWVGRPLTTPQKRIAGAAAGGRHKEETGWFGNGF